MSQQGFLYIVKEDCLVELDDRNQEFTGDRKVQLVKGDIIEFRYHSPCHFRTYDNKWFKIEEDEWDNYFTEIAKISEDVKWKNIANTKQIWDLQLFKWTNQKFYDLLIEEKSNDS